MGKNLAKIWEDHSSMGVLKWWKGNEPLHTENTDLEGRLLCAKASRTTLECVLTYNLSSLLQCPACLARMVVFNSKILPSTCNLSSLMQCPACLARVVVLTAKYCTEPITSRPCCSVQLASLKWLFLIAKYCLQSIISCP